MRPYNQNTQATVKHTNELIATRTPFFRHLEKDHCPTATQTGVATQNGLSLQIRVASKSIVAPKSTVARL